MKAEQFKRMVEEADASEEYFQACAELAAELPSRLREQLGQLVNGPVWDGDVISKSDRDELFEMGLAVRVCLKGEQGYTGAPYISYTIMKYVRKFEE